MNIEMTREQAEALVVLATGDERDATEATLSNGADGIDALRAALDAPEVCWTTMPPTEPGWYVIVHADSPRDPQICVLYRDLFNGTERPWQIATMDGGDNQPVDRAIWWHPTPIRMPAPPSTEGGDGP